MSETAPTRPSAMPRTRSVSAVPIATRSSPRTPSKRPAAISTSWTDRGSEEHQADHTRSLPPGSAPSKAALWRVVEASVRAAAAMRERTAERDAEESRVHEDELSGWHIRDEHDNRRSLHSPLATGASAGQWDSLARLFDEPAAEDLSSSQIAATPLRQRIPSSISSSSGLSEQVASTSVLTDPSGSGIRVGRSLRTGSPGPKGWARFLSPPRKQTRRYDTVGSPLRSPSGRPDSSVSDEPMSFLDQDPEHIPRGEDPLAWGEDKRLLDDDSEEESMGVKQASTSTSVTKPVGWIGWLRHALHLRPVTKDIVKCALAYFFASLFTYSPFMSNLMADILPDREGLSIPISNLFMVATVTVWFHPGRSIGSMLEANIFALLAFVYAVMLGLASMITAVGLHEANMPVLSNVLSVILFLGAGMGFVGYARATIVRSAFSSACSLIGVIVFTVVAKEGSTHLGRFSTDKVYDVTLVVVMGVLVTNTVCLCLWPQSACTNLEHDIQRNLQSFATLLRVLTKTFLLDDPAQFHIKSDRIKRASDNLHSSFTSLKKNLAEAKLEAPFDRRIRGQVSSYVRVVDSMNSLALDLGGLRSSCGLQHDIMAAQRAARQEARAHGVPVPPHDQTAAVADAFAGRPLSTVIDAPSEAGDAAPATEEEEELEKKANAFNAFLETVGPHMRSLVFTCARTLTSLRSAFDAASQSSDEAVDGEGAQSFESLASDVSTALKRFQHEQTIATKRLYTVYPLASKRESNSGSGFTAFNAGARLDGSKADEEVFVIFYFLFLLEEFSRELQTLVEEMDKIRAHRVHVAATASRFWWMRPWSIFSSGEANPHRRRGPRRGLVTRFIDIMSLSSGPNAPDWPSHKRHQLNTDQTPAAVTLKQRIARWVWQAGEFLRQPDTKFGLKAGIGCALLAAPAFITVTRPLFTAYQGQWALVTFMVVLQPTMGQSNAMAMQQILGTITGASVAYVARTLFGDDNIALPLFGLLYSLPCYHYIITKPARASAGRFSIVTYNLVALYSYTLRGEGMDVEELAFRRTVAVVAGVVFAAAMNQLVWPFEARRELANGMSELLFNLSALYQRLVLTYSSQPPQAASAEDDGSDVEEQRSLLGLQPIHDEMQAMELHLQRHLIKLESLLAHTRNEPRLKGPFPVGTYKKYLGCCQNILDKLHALRSVTSRTDWHTRVRRDFVIPVDATGLRREMVGNVLLFFYLLGSAFHLKTPLPPYLPPAERSRLALLDAIRELPAVKRRAIQGRSSEYLLYYSYALSMKDLIWQLEEIGRLTKGAFGVLGGSDEAFESQFRRGEHSTAATPWQTPRVSYVQSEE